jgi:uncharacterized Zn-binding protein involved in type VI secretion
MPNDVGANGQSIVTQKSGGKLFTGPDVCKTPSPGGPIPIPYPNIAMSSDLATGSKKVKINGVPACLKGSNFSKSMGDQAGAVGGVISGKTGGMAEPTSYSFDVKIEGKNAVRNLDLFQSNQKNTPPAPVMQAPIILGVESSEDEEAKCPYCNKTEHEFAKKWGNNIGSGQGLRKNIIAKLEDHPWYTGLNSLQAHHLICSEAMDDDDWSEFARIFGYDINHENNGVMLPYLMELACQLHVPLHRGNHDKGKAEGVSYPDRIKTELKEIKEGIKAGKYCDSPKALVEKLDNFSKLTLKKIDKFSWTITSDGKDYATGKNGCAGVTSLTDKPNTTCPHDRVHGLAKQNGTAVIPRKSGPLQIGQ